MSETSARKRGGSREEPLLESASLLVPDRPLLQNRAHVLLISVSLLPDTVPDT